MKKKTCHECGRRFPNHLLTKGKIKLCQRCHNAEMDRMAKEIEAMTRAMSRFGRY